MREAFEAWAKSIVCILSCWDSGRYTSDRTNVAWEAWQAAVAWEREEAAKECDIIAADQYALYKGRPPYTGSEPGRANPHTDGMSDGAAKCANAIRARCVRWPESGGGGKK